MRPFERLVRFDLRTSFSARQNSTSLVHDYRENYRDRERETFLKWRTNYNFLQTFRYIYTFLIEDIIFLSLVKNKLIAKKVFVDGKSLSRYLRMPKFGQRWFEECWKRRRRSSGCWGIDKPSFFFLAQATGFSSLVSLFFLFPVPYTRGDVIRSCNIESESLWNLLIKSFEIWKKI